MTLLVNLMGMLGFSLGIIIVLMVRSLTVWMQREWESVYWNDQQQSLLNRHLLRPIHPLGSVLPGWYVTSEDMWLPPKKESI